MQQGYRMKPTPTIAIFDIGKTNKKLFLFDENYQIVWEKTANLPETTDEDGDVCEDVALLTAWVKEAFAEAQQVTNFEIKALNFSTYGASFVHVNADGEPVAPLYNYLKPYDEALQKQFYDTYGGEKNFAVAAASPILGNLNSGMQIYRLKYEKPELFQQIKYSLHLPQYISSIFTKQFYSDITSIGCHTNLWDFSKKQYHEWVKKEAVLPKLPEINSTLNIPHSAFRIGIGLHDSSSALIPYLINFHVGGIPQPFILLSTGTWCISINPFNDTPLTYEELQYDCLCFLTYQAKPVKASRLFAGYEHEAQTKRLATHFGVPDGYYKTVLFDPQLIDALRANSEPIADGDRFTLLKNSPFVNRDLAIFGSYEEAYHQFILDLITQQLISTELVLHNSPVRRIFVDGGFSKNPIFMNLLANAFPEVEVFAASVAQASALGAALVMHDTWNTKPLRNDLIDLKYYAHIR